MGLFNRVSSHWFQWSVWLWKSSWWQLTALFLVESFSSDWLDFSSAFLGGKGGGGETTSPTDFHRGISRSPINSNISPRPVERNIRHSIARDLELWKVSLAMFDFVSIGFLLGWLVCWQRIIFPAFSWWFSHYYPCESFCRVTGLV